MRYGAPPIADVELLGHSAWAVGSAGVLTSPDGGRHWKARLRGPRHGFGRVDFIDAHHGWAVGAAQLLATADGGAHWHQVADPECRPIRMVAFVTATRGFAVAAGSRVAAPGSLPAADGMLLATRDAGRSWARLPAPPDAQSVCFRDTTTGWLGTAHGIYATSDGGHNWRRIVAAPGGRLHAEPIVEVHCGGSGTAWALAIVPAAASSQMPHIGWRLTTRGGTPLFAEQYFPHPAVAVHRAAPGSYPGPVGRIDATTAAFFDNCPACGAGKVPWLVATDGGRTLLRRHPVDGLTEATATAFVTAREGCLAGLFRRIHHHRLTAPIGRIVCTRDSGRHWHTAWQQAPRRR